MNLTYSVLWFDDTEEVFDSLDLESTTDVIKELGFDLEVTFVNKPEDFNSYDPYEQFDLIVVDYNLEEFDAHGEEFIKKIRDHGVFTEIIFYSANPAEELWNAVKEEQLEGIFISNRGGILTKIEKVAHQSVRKVLDIENMRGILMAEVGEIDIGIEQVLQIGLNQLDDEKQQEVFKRFFEKSMEQVDKNITALESFEKAPSVETLCLLSDSDKKYSNLCRLLKAHPSLDKSNFGNYRTDVLSPRNCLAHGVPENKGEGKFVFSHHGKEYEFDSDVAKELRHTILAYKAQLDAIKDTLEENAA